MLNYYWKKNFVESVARKFGFDYLYFDPLRWNNKGPSVVTNIWFTTSKSEKRKHCFKLLNILW